MSQPRKASGITPEPIKWLGATAFGQRIPRGMLTLVAGRPDQGKGLFATWLAAEVSRAGGNVLYSAAEDSDELMTRPRLEAAGADLDRVWLWSFQLPLNGRELNEIVVENDIDLIVMDPMAAHLSGGISRHSDNIRTVLKPLTRLIESTGSSVIMIDHVLKRTPQSGTLLGAIGGSGSGLPAAARAAYVLGVDPDDADRRVLAQAKFNIGPKPKALAFEIDVVDIELVGDQPYLIPDEELQVFDGMRLFEKVNPNKVGRPSDKKAAACEWLTTYLADNGPTKADDVFEDAKQYQMSHKTLKRASQDMGVIKNPPGGGRNCVWDLPDDVKELMGIPLADEDETPPVTDEETKEQMKDWDEGLTELLGTPPTGDGDE